MNNLRYIQQNLYNLKREYGLPIGLYRLGSTTTDRSTGVVSRSYTKVDIKRVLILESRHWQQFQYDLSYIMSSRQFSMGGVYDVKQRVFLIDMRDYADILEPETMYIVYQDRKYQIKEVHTFEHNTARAVLGKETVSDDFIIIHDRKVVHCLEIEDEFVVA